jgi:hypothetical protein
VNIDADGLIWATAILPARPAFARLARPPKRHYTFARRYRAALPRSGVARCQLCFKALIWQVYLFLSPRRFGDAAALSVVVKQAL